MRVGEEDLALVPQTKPEVIRAIVAWFAEQYGLGVVGDILEALSDDKLKKLWNDIRHIKTGTWDDVKGIRVYEKLGPIIASAARAESEKSSTGLLLIAGLALVGGKKKGRRRR